GADTDSVEMDKATFYGLASTTLLEVTTMPAPPLSLTVAAQEIAVGAYETPWSGTVKMSVPLWLQPDKAGQLTDPSASLEIGEARMRGNDRVFNRREVIR
ncbi:MAG: hypothetical protein R3311_06175, partial [Oceanisphaera sp.]|nr:hypothetical protein [Oceanisphaera sp.]